MTFEEGDDRDGLMECAYCGGQFVPDDMDGEHCHDCVEELFGEDE